MNSTTCNERSAIQSLELRRLFSAMVENGTLVVVGTNGPDRIRMWEDQRGAQVVIVGYIDALLLGRPAEGFEVPADGVRSVVVRALAGDDDVDLADAPLGPTTGPISIPSRIDAGLGHDQVFGTGVRDFILGGFGNDRIQGYEGTDWIDGGWGNDFLSGGGGNDWVSGGRGNDTVHGNEGDDRLSGGPGDDHVGFNLGGPAGAEHGNDVLSGGSGEDWMLGGQGRDRIFGDAGRDHFSVIDDETEKLDRTADEPDDVPMVVA